MGIIDAWTAQTIIGYRNDDLKKLSTYHHVNG
jgi:hypothetical protein